ncbi:MAG TPA: hypothetical protein VNX66_04740 [Candidatus Sulfotelmatobacter sp.]|nr:hypothetical protein [Candidatus Sulfotelmatobacter sp.]
MLTVAQLAPLKERDPYLYETLVKVVSAVNATSQRSGVDPSAPSPAPTPIASLTVRAANGWFDLAVNDPPTHGPGFSPQQISTESPISQRFLLTVRPISYIMLTTKSGRVSPLFVSCG